MYKYCIFVSFNVAEEKNTYDLCDALKLLVINQFRNRVLSNSPHRVVLIIKISSVHTAKTIRDHHVYIVAPNNPLT